MQQVHRLAAHGQSQRPGNGFLADAVQRGLFLVHHKARLRLVRLDIPVGIHDAGGILENADDLVRQRQAAFRRWPVNLGDERLQHGRAGRHLGHGDTRAVFGRDRRDARANPLGDVMALGFALAF